jgi:putative aminopeptidase FrvX
MKAFVRTAVLIIVLGWPYSAAHGQKSSVPTDWQLVLRTPAVSGHEQLLAEEIRKRLKGFSPKTDTAGNVYVNVGTGAPHRLIVTPIDEPGYVIRQIDDDGYLRVQRVPQRAPNAAFDMLHVAQPVTIETRSGSQVSGVFAGFHADELYLDIGASSREEVRKAGVGLSDPVVMARQWFPIGNGGEAGPATGDRFGAYALVQVLKEVRRSKATGTTTVAFLTRQWTGGYGLSRILAETHPDEMVYVGRVTTTSNAARRKGPSEAQPGTGVVIGSPSIHSGSDRSLAAKMRAIAKREHISVHLIASKGPQIGGDIEDASIPKRWVELGVPTLWPVTPGECEAWSDVAQLRRLLEVYLDIPKATGPSGENLMVSRRPRPSEALIGSYGVSGHEEAVREIVLSRLDLRLRKMAGTDTAGNLALHLGDGEKDQVTPRIVFVAHMDEFGYEVRKIENDGRLQVEMLGEANAQYFLGHVVLVHTKDGSQIGGVLELPTGWDKAGFEWPNGRSSRDERAHVYVGTHTQEETEKLGIAPGDFVTIPETYRRLLGMRANAGSLDDRVGCAALIAAANAIGPELPGRDVTFVWSTEGEVGSTGAVAFARQAAKEGRVPDIVFAVDAFASSASPLESQGLGDVKLGRGFVVGAVHNTSGLLKQYVERVVALAKKEEIPVQYGAASDGSEGAAFERYGSVDLTLGWPLRYLHSPAEVMDARDLMALDKIVEVLAREW